MLILTAKAGDRFDMKVQTATETIYFTVHVKEADRNNGMRCAFDAPQNVRVQLVKRNAIEGWDQNQDKAPAPRPVVDAPHCGRTTPAKPRFRP